MRPFLLSHYTLTTAAGCGSKENLRALQTQHSGLQKNNFLDVELDTWIGRVAGLEDISLPEHLSAFQCRNNALAYMALQQDNFIASIEQAKQRFGAHRVGVFLGTSTSGILESELAYQTETFQASGQLPKPFYFYQRHNIFSASDFVRHYLQLEGPAQVISTACSSSAKVFASAARYIELGLCDAAIVGGVDSLCMTTLYGFNSLELIAQDVCRPADKHRQGLSIGEAAAFVLLEKTPQNAAEHTSSTNDIPVYLLGWGESSDAWHMSTPHPEGRGAYQAMQQALNMAQCSERQVDYVNLHGTATRVNDVTEDKAMQRLFSQPVACSSTKGWTGHTLGAAGAVEAIYSAMSLQENFMPASLQTRELDPQIKQNILMAGRTQDVHTVMTNSFGFGGNNCSLLFGDQIC